MTENWRVKIGEFLGLHAATELGHIEFIALLGHFRRGNLLTFQQALQFALVRGGHGAADACLRNDLFPDIYNPAFVCLLSSLISWAHD